MKERLRSLTAGVAPPITVHIVREYLQGEILLGLQRAKAMRHLAFCGGTALRFLYNLPRYSEDLDFSLEIAPESFDFKAAMTRVKRELEAVGFEPEVKLREHGCHRGRDGAISRPTSLRSPHTPTRCCPSKSKWTPIPSKGWTRHHRCAARNLLNLHHHDKPSLLADKVHALLMRNHVKGRDVYDLVWYLSDPKWPAPNLEMLNNALLQTGWSRALLDQHNWADAVANRIIHYHWAVVQRDVEPFLERAHETDLLNAETVLGLLQR